MKLRPQGRSKTSGINSFFKKEKESLCEAIVRFVTKDGISFNQIARSELTRRAFKSDGFDSPVSHQGVRNQFMRGYKLTWRALPMIFELQRKRVLVSL